MSDEQRGPYTPPREGPPREAPLQFDARRARDARPMPMTLIASGGVLALLLGGVIMAYAGGFHQKDDPAKTVGDRVLVMKTVPAATAANSSDPAPATAAHAAAPNFASAPEEPAPRPKPRLQVKAQALPPVRIAGADPDASSVAAGVPTSTLLPTTTAPTPAKAKPAVKTTQTVPMQMVRSASATRTSAEGAKAFGPAGVQIGAFSSHDLADKGFADVGKLVSTGGHGKRIEAVERGGSTLYRTTVTGFADRDAAKSFCEALAAKGHACIVKG